MSFRFVPPPLQSPFFRPGRPGGYPRLVCLVSPESRKNDQVPDQNWPSPGSKLCHRASVRALPHERDGALREITKTQHAAPVGPSTSLGLRRTSSVPVALLAVRVPCPTARLPPARVPCSARVKKKWPSPGSKLCQVPDEKCATGRACARIRTKEMVPCVK